MSVLSVRVSDDWSERFRQVAADLGLSVSQLLRFVIERAVLEGEDEFAEFDTTEAEFDQAFYEEDEPAEDVIAAFNHGPSGVTSAALPLSCRTWACEHMSVSGPISFRPTGWCGCDMQAVA
jgi:antitoxin component of RelBE/YafQ-DinJ toxin-antitoxin module